MARLYSFIVKNVNPVSQNNRSKKMVWYRNLLKTHFNIKYPNLTFPLPNGLMIKNPTILHGKVFYIHKVYDPKDADNISKPLWDALQYQLFEDDNQILHRQALKVKENQPNILALNVTEMADMDYYHLIEFLIDSNNSDDRLMYIELSDYKSENVIF
jgi:Holliday junction resolvase RusA-like endonuclease